MTKTSSQNRPSEISNSVKWFLSVKFKTLDNILLDFSL